MAITRVKLENFTVFESLDLEPSPGINVLVGANGTGKTHLLKVCYCLSEFTTVSAPVYEKLLNAFLPSRRSIRRFINHSQPELTATIEVYQRDVSPNPPNGVGRALEQDITGVERGPPRRIWDGRGQ